MIILKGNILVKKLKKEKRYYCMFQLYISQRRLLTRTQCASIHTSRHGSYGEFFKDHWGTLLDYNPYDSTVILLLWTSHPMNREAVDLNKGLTFDRNSFNRKGNLRSLKSWPYLDTKSDYAVYIKVGEDSYVIGVPVKMSVEGLWETIYPEGFFNKSVDHLKGINLYKNYLESLNTDSVTMFLPKKVPDICILL